MGTTVYSIRIRRKIKEMREEIRDVNWQEELRRLVEERVREEYKKRLLKEARELRMNMKTNVPASKLIRVESCEHKKKCAGYD
ncbi:type II toxin-antitoxin system VapB family antitoxin [Archaeoglobus sp.]